MGTSYMQGGEKRSGERTGVSVLSTPRPKPFPQGAAVGVRRDQHASPSGPAPGAVPVHASPIGQPIAPNIGPGEPRGPADVMPGGRWP
jgi:hypothetical protein